MELVDDLMGEEYGFAFSFADKPSQEGGKGKFCLEIACRAIGSAQEGYFCRKIHLLKSKTSSFLE